MDEQQQDEFGLKLRPELDFRGRVERAFNRFHTVIPADSTGSEVIRGRARTRYFYRQQAISWARLARTAWTGEMRETFTWLAKDYLAQYRHLCTSGARL